MMIYIWLTAIVFFVVVELITPQLVSIWFALGSAAALISCLLSAPIALQILIFAVASSLFVLVSRPLYKKYVKKRVVPTNIDALIDKEGIVAEDINNMAFRGQVIVSGQYWSARSENDELIPEGTKVKVQRIEGVKLIVKKL